MKALTHHQMDLQRTLSSGAEEWYCPSCGRRFLMWWNPYAKTILHAGDEGAWHTGDRSSPVMGGAAALPDAVLADADDEALADGLRPWLKWINNAGFDEYWSQGA